MDKENKVISHNPVAESDGTFETAINTNPKVNSELDMVENVIISKTKRAQIKWLENHPEYMIMTKVVICKEPSHATVEVFIPGADVKDVEIGKNLKVKIRREVGNETIDYTNEGQDSYNEKIVEKSSSKGVEVVEGSKNKSVTIIEGNKAKALNVKKGVRTEVINIDNNGKVTREFK